MKAADPSDQDKIIEKLFTYPDNKQIDKNKRRSLIVNPQMFRVLIHQHQTLKINHKLSVWSHVSQIYQSNSLNSAILVKRDYQILEFNHSIYDEIITFIFSIKAKIQDNQNILASFKPLLAGYPITCRNIKNMISKVSVNFHSERFDSQKLQLCIQLLTFLFKDQVWQQSIPQCYFTMYGPNSGLRLANQELKWSLNKGFYYFIGFQIQKGEHQQSYLLSILINSEAFELVLDEGNYLKIKVFGATKLFTIKRLQSKKWYFLKLSYFLKTGIIRNSFHAILHIEGEPYQFNDLPIPSLSMKDKIDELIVGHNFYGKVSTAVISRQDLHGWPRSSFNTFDKLQSFLHQNKNSLKQIFLFYTPLIFTTFNFNCLIYDIMNKNHAQMLDNTGLFHQPFESIDINYYGGLYTLLPFFYILRFYKYQTYPTALEESLEMVFNLFVLKYRNIQQQALNCQFFGILAQFFNHLDERYFTLKVIEMIRVWRELIKSKELLEDFFVKFLMKFSIDRIQDKKIANLWMKIIANIYYRDFYWAIELFPVSDFLWYVIDNFQPKNQKQCCLMHFYQEQQNNDYQKILQIKDQYKNKGSEVKEILSFIIKNIVETKKFQLLARKCDIIQFLLHNYSICFKALLMQCLLVGIELEHTYFRKNTQLLQTIYALLPQALTKDQLIPILQILNLFIEPPTNKLSINLNQEIITHISQHLNSIYMKKYAKIKLRSKSQVLQNTILVRKQSERKLSVKQEEQSMEQVSQVNINKQKQKQLKAQVIRIRKFKKNTLDKDKSFYSTILSMCCIQDIETGDLVLKDDEFMRIMAPYYKICDKCFKNSIIEIVKISAFLKSAQEQLPPHMESLSKFDILYRFILSQFVLKQLDPQSPDYQPSQSSNYIMKNLYHIIDNMVNSMKNDWDSLYLYLLRLIELLKEARKDIQVKTSRSSQEILLATKVSSRKFILRILNWAQENISNMCNMVFFVFLVVFNNDENSEYSIFEEFKNLQHHFFIDKIEIVNQFQHRTIQEPIFIDQRIILSVIEAFHFDLYFKDNSRKNLLNQIRAYLERQQENQLQAKMFKFRDLFKSSIQFRQMGRQGNKGFRGILINTKNQEDNKDKHNLGSLKIYFSEIMTLLLCLCLESSINERRYEALKESLNNVECFLKVFILSMTRDNLKKQRHQQRNRQLPISLVLRMLHFLYRLLDKDLSQNFYGSIEKAILNIINYLTLVMTILCQKIGNPQNSEEVQMLSAVMVDVELYNFFTFGILVSNVITIGQIKVFSTLDQEKALQIIHHPRLRQYFKEAPKISIQTYINEVVEIHGVNLQKVQKQLQEKFMKKNNAEKIVIESDRFYDRDRFVELQLNYARTLNLDYRKLMRIWRKVWKRLRLYHYYWSIGMNQYEKFEEQWKKNSEKRYKHKFSKYTDLECLRPIIQVEPNQPWHIKKAQLDEQLEYRSKNFMANLHKEKLKKQLQPKSFIQKIFRKSHSGNQFSVLWIKHNSKRKGTLSIEKQKLFFEYDSTFQKDSHVDFTPFLLAQHKPMKKSWPIVCITNLFRRRYLTKFQCLLIQFEDNSALIFNFLDENIQDFLIKIEQLQEEKQDKANLMKLNNIRFYLKNFRSRNIYQEIQQITQQWCQGKLTNLHYLMIINKYAGRSCLDPVNYPVVPWVIANYECKELVLRDLSKTLGALGSETRRQLYENKYETTDPFNNVPPYQYGTHYSSPGVVFNFLIRISPYTEAAKNLQGGRFDLSDRLFSSIKVCWNSVTSEVSDVRELLPEFYYLPQFLINIENYDFGLTQLKERVHNVKLALWGQDPWQFIANHRRVLESEEVTSNINNWIDLIFGYKQKGKIAKENLNLYYYLTYENSIDLDQIDNQVEKTSIQAQIIHFGQTPTQLFYKPHPENKKVKQDKKLTDLHKIKFLGILQSNTPPLLLGFQGTQIPSLILFRDSYLICISEGEKIELKSEVNLMRTASKQNLYHVQDVQCINKVQIFSQNRFIVIGSYVNGDLVVFTTSGQKIEHHKGFSKSIVYVNKAQNLILCGSKNGLLEVFEIVYLDKGMLKLIKILSEYFMYPIEHISEGAGFYSMTCGNLVIISKIFRSLAYVHEKIKMQGQKLIRSFESRRKIFGSFICTNPLYCVVFYNYLQVMVYSINGQFLKLKQVESLIEPILIIDEKKRENLLILQPNGLFLLKVPDLQTIFQVPIPKKQYSHMKLINNRVYLVTPTGEIFYVFNQKESLWL